MTERDLSERLCIIGCRVAQMADHEDESINIELLAIAKELHVLSDEKYTPGSVSWADVQKQVNPTSTKKVYHDRNHRELPF